MKIRHPFVLLLGLLSSCGTYRYYQQTPNPALFSQAGDFQISGDIGSSGACGKVSAALSDNIGVMGSFNSGLEKTYKVSEWEIAAGYYGSSKERLGFFASAGYGFGHNAKFSESQNHSKLSEGSFQKPFIQINYGLSSQDILWGIRGDLVGVLKANYLIYDGNHMSDGSRIHSRYTILEPGFVIGVGGKNARFDIGYGFPITMRLERLLSSSYDARTLPGSISIGLRLRFDHSADK